MASTASIVTAIVIAIIIIIAGAAGLTLLKGGGPGSGSTSTSATSPSHSHSNSTTATTSHSSSSTVTTTSTTSTSTTTSSSSSSSIPPSYSLILDNAGSGPVLDSSMHTYLAYTQFPGDGPCCSIPPVYSDIVTYTDSGNTWTWQGDLNPGSAYATDNGSGFTITYSTAAGCPHAERFGGTEAFDDCSFYGNVASSPANATLFSVDVYMPYYSYYSYCQPDTERGGSGCTYEITPYNEAALGVDVGGNIVYVAFAQVCNSPCTSNGMRMLAYTSQGGSSILQTLNQTTVSTYTPFHKLTIATDRSSYIELYVDNTLVYSNHTMPIDLSGGSPSIILSERTSINGETDIVTWSNALAHSSSFITASGLPSGASLVVTGANGWSSSQTANSNNGTVAVNVALNPSNLSVSVELNGKTLASYSGAVQTGSVFSFATNT